MNLMNLMKVLLAAILQELGVVIIVDYEIILFLHFNRDFSIGNIASEILPLFTISPQHALI